MSIKIENKLPSWFNGELYTHSYGFNTANGRGIIETIKNYYYEYKRD